MLLLAAAVFVGSPACRPCHAGIAETWERSPMARSSGRAEPLPAASFVAAGHRYEIEGKRLGFEGGSARFDYFIGSNAAGRSFLWERDGYLFELPVTWYAGKRIWDASPGYEGISEIRLTRPVEASCLLCHASQVRPVLGTQNRFGEPPFLENGVGCERCHGPGSEHVRDPAKARMVNPAGLDAERRDAVCSQCHLTGEARIETAGRRFAEFRAGERLADYATYFVWQSGRRDFKVTSHVEKLASSGCKRGAGEALWCGTCHDPHGAEDEGAKTQAACLNCHAAAHRQQENCAGCHMPRAKASDAGHGMLTDHSIPRVPRGARAVGESRELVAFPGTADDRSLGLAYAELGDARAREFLLRARPADWAVRLRLAVTETDARRAAALYESVLNERPGEVSALVNLGTIYAAAGRTAEAGELWERALVANPATEQAVLNLSKIRPSAVAAGILRRYLELEPRSRAVRDALDSLR